MRIWQLLEQNLLPMQPSGDTPSEAGWLYHATNLEGAESIHQDRQFAVHEPWHGTDQETWPDGSEAPRAYFTANAGVAWQFAPEEGQSVLLRVPEGVYDFRRESTGDFYAQSPVPATEAQILVSGGKWYPLKVFFGRMGESADVGTPDVGAPNRQSPDAIPAFMTVGGAPATPSEPVIPEFKQEEFNDELESLMDDTGHGQSELERMDIDELDQMAFGITQGRHTFPTDKITIVYQDDWKNVVHVIKKVLPSMGIRPEVWAAKVLADEEPVDVWLRNDQFELQDGHHRYMAAKILGRDLPVELEIKDNPIKAILDKRERDRVKEVDHPEFMPTEGPARYDPELELGNADERQRDYNTGSTYP